MLRLYRCFILICVHIYRFILLFYWRCERGKRKGGDFVSKSHVTESSQCTVLSFVFTEHSSRPKSTVSISWNLTPSLLSQGMGLDFSVREKDLLLSSWISPNTQDFRILRVCHKMGRRVGLRTLYRSDLSIMTCLGIFSKDIGLESWVRRLRITWTSPSFLSMTDHWTPLVTGF